MLSFSKERLVSPSEALPDRQMPISVTCSHFINGTALVEPFPAGMQKVVFALGCFWGAERLFWQQEGVYSTAVGYAGGYTVNPTYDDVCTAQTGHTEVVLVVYDPKLISLERLLKVFWEAHNPTEGMRQGNDKGTQYRSAIYTSSEADLAIVQASAQTYQKALTDKGLGAITTEIKLLEHFYYAEEYHQQYLAKNPGGYCGLRGTGVTYAL